jgi:RNA polymerase sigma factor (sigma-70 family)
MVKYQSGEAQSFDALYTRHSARVLGYLINRLKSRLQAEEALQNAFLKLHRFRHHYRAGEPFGPWFFTLVQNTLVDLQRREGRNPATPEREDPTAALEALLAPSAASASGTGNLAAEDWLSRLDKDQREALELRYLKDLSFETMAARLGISASSARQRVSRAIRKLRVIAGGSRD